MKKKIAKKIAFLDRDGVINKCAPEHEYITSISDFVFNESVFSVLQRLKEDGYEFIVVTNQRGISRKKLTVETLSKIHSHMTKVLKSHGINLLGILYCPHAVNSCDCRKPKDGLLRQAVTKYDINIEHSIIISDSTHDVSMGEAFGLKQSILVNKNKPKEALTKYQQDKIRIAFIKYGGMSNGGTEKMLQIIAANLDKNKFKVDYYYCDSSTYKGSNSIHLNTDSHRLHYMEKSGVNLIKFSVEAKDLTSPFHNWIDTNFWEVFNEENYDIVQTGRSGHKEFPFNKIRNVPIVDIIALSAGSDNQYNISKVMHICKWSADIWTKSGGDKSRVSIISLPIEVENKPYNDLRITFALEDKFIYGMHQRPSNDIFSEIPLLAYKSIESKDTAFVILGGGAKYKEQAKSLGLKNIYFLPATGDSSVIFEFLSTLNVYSHGRKDGEVNSQAMAEAMYFGLPIVSHTSKVNNGHIECIGDAGKVVITVEEYANELKRLQLDKQYLATKQEVAKKRFQENYELSGQMKIIENIYKSVIKDPFPFPWRRRLYALHWTQNIRIWMKWVYLKSKYYLLGRV